jgi:hypothetical protein
MATAPVITVMTAIIVPVVATVNRRATIVTAINYRAAIIPMINYRLIVGLINRFGIIYPVHWVIITGAYMCARRVYAYMETGLCMS